MGRVTGEEDPPGAHAVRQGRPGAEVRGPAQLGHGLGGEVRAGGDDLPYALQREVRGRPVRELCHQLEVLRAGERAEREVAVGVTARREDVPVVPVQAADPDVGHQRRVRVEGLARHADAEQSAHRRAAAVRRDGVPGGDGLARGEFRAHPVRVLCQPYELPAEGHLSSQFRQPRVQDLLRAPLRHHPRLRVRRVLARLGRVEHPVLAGPPAVLPDHPHRVGAARRADRVQHPQIVEDLHRARLDALAPRAREQRLRPLDDQRVHTAPGEVDAERQAGRARAHHQYVRVHDPSSP